LIGRDGHIKITDFGLSKYGVGPDEKSYSFVGTPEYLAPEILIGQGHNFVCDFWSLVDTKYMIIGSSCV
jgi:serine/threonine protein kinase